MNAQPPQNALSAYLGKPVIPYVTEVTDGNIELMASSSIVFVGGGELADLPKTLGMLDSSAFDRIPVMLHIDLVSGLSNDESGLRYVATLDRIDGIITVRHHLSSMARKLGLMTIVRLFLQDARAVERGLQVIEKSKPDAVELLPGVAVLEVADRFHGIAVPRIAGGLIRSRQTVRNILDSGCIAVSTTNVDLWKMNQ